jgi:hypothetical protein
MNLFQFESKNYGIYCYINEHNLYCFDMWCFQSRNIIDHGFFDTLTGCQRCVFEILKDVMAEEISKERSHAK